MGLAHEAGPANVQGGYTPAAQLALMPLLATHEAAANILLLQLLQAECDGVGRCDDEGLPLAQHQMQPDATTINDL